VGKWGKWKANQKAIGATPPAAQTDRNSLTDVVHETRPSAADPQPVVQPQQQVQPDKKKNQVLIQAAYVPASGCAL